MNAIAKGAMVCLATGCVTMAIAAGKNMQKNKTRCYKASKKKAEHAVKSIGVAMQDLASIIK
ncbi:MAG: hypothetical protein K2G97_04000 [Oscillospiraceae bacterium]|nr:hypothetical protein [Oscillospiraceae bacterium]